MSAYGLHRLAVAPTIVESTGIRLLPDDVSLAMLAAVWMRARALQRSVEARSRM